MSHFTAVTVQLHNCLSNGISWSFGINEVHYAVFNLQWDIQGHFCAVKMTRDEYDVLLQSFVIIRFKELTVKF